MPAMPAMPAKPLVSWRASCLCLKSLKGTIALHAILRLFQHTRASLETRLTQQNRSVKSRRKGSNLEAFSKLSQWFCFLAEGSMPSELQQLCWKYKILTMPKLCMERLRMNLTKHHLCIEFSVFENHPTRACERTETKELGGWDCLWRWAGRGENLTNNVIFQLRIQNIVWGKPPCKKCSINFTVISLEYFKTKKCNINVFLTSTIIATFFPNDKYFVFFELIISVLVFEKWEYFFLLLALELNQKQWSEWEENGPDTTVIWNNPTSFFWQPFYKQILASDPGL